MVTLRSTKYYIWLWVDFFVVFFFGWCMYDFVLICKWCLFQIVWLPGLLFKSASFTLHTCDSCTVNLFTHDILITFFLFFCVCIIQPCTWTFNYLFYFNIWWRTLVIFFSSVTFLFWLYLFFWAESFIIFFPWFSRLFFLFFSFLCNGYHLPYGIV